MGQLGEAGAGGADRAQGHRADENAGQQLPDHTRLIQTGKHQAGQRGSSIDEKQPAATARGTITAYDTERRIGRQHRAAARRGGMPGRGRRLWGDHQVA